MFKTILPTEGIPGDLLLLRAPRSPSLLFNQLDFHNTAVTEAKLLILAVFFQLLSQSKIRKSPETNDDHERSAQALNHDNARGHHNLRLDYYAKRSNE